MAGLGMARVLVAGNDFGCPASSTLEAEGYSVLDCELEAAVAHTDSFRPDVVVIDATNVVVSVEVCETLRRRSHMPLIIVVGGQVAEVDVVAMLKAGADVFVTRPIGGRELVARVRASLRRVPPRRNEDPDILELAGVHLDRDARRVRVGKVLVRLAPREYEILEALMRSAGQLVPRAALARTRWGGTSEAKSLDVQVRRLRAKLASIDGVRRIEAVRGVGYRFGTVVDTAATERVERVEVPAAEIDLREEFPAVVDADPGLVSEARFSSTTLRYT